MLNNLVSRMVRQGATSQEVLQAAIEMSRDAFQRVVSIEKHLDRAFGGSHFRCQTVEPLLQKERQIEALRARLARGEAGRGSDDNTLQTLLAKHTAEYEALRSEFPWADLAARTRDLVRTYIQERREHLELGDADRIRSAYRQAACELAVAC